MKKYFYVIRPAVALLWLDVRPNETPPMSLPTLLSGVDVPADVGSAIVELRDRKSQLSEFGTGGRIDVLDRFCQERIRWAQERLLKSAQRADAELKREAARMFEASVFGRGHPPASR